MDILLLFCVDSNDDVRYIANKIVCEQLVSIDQAGVTDKITTFVERVLQSLSLPEAPKTLSGVKSEEAGNPEVEDGEVPTEETDTSPAAQMSLLLSHGPSDVMGCRHRTELYKALCLKDNTLLALATEAFGTMKPLFQGAFAAEVSQHDAVCSASANT